MASSLNKEIIEKEKPLVHEHLLGKSIDRKNPQSGISEARIDVDDIGNIPGTIEHWQYDLDLRKQEIEELSSRSFMKRAIGVLNKKKVSGGRVTGEELTKFFPTKKNAAMVAQLKTNPSDSFARLELVTSFAKIKQNFPVELYRALFLQAMVACSLGDLNSQGLQVTVYAQYQYFYKLFNKCKEGLDKYHNNLKTITIEQNTRDQRSSIEQQIREVQRNMKILRLYQLYTGKAMKDNQPGDFSVTYKEIKRFYKKVEDSEEFKQSKIQLVNKLISITNILRYLPLLHSIAHELLDLFIQLDQENAIGYFLKGRVGMSALTFAVNRYEGGDQTKKCQTEIQESFKTAYHQYGLAVGKIDSHLLGTKEYTILIEYAQAIFYFYNTATTLLEIKLPRQWAQSALTKASKALIMAKDSGKVDALQEKILMAMENEGY